MTDSRIRKRVLILCAALLLGITASWPAHASFEDGVRAYLAQDYDAALKAWEPLANDGHAPAQFGMGLSYENGRGVERDPAQAAIWYRKAAEQDLADAQFNLGNLYLNALGVPKDPVEAVRWFRRAAEQNMPHAQVNLGYSYETGSGVAKDPVKAVTWYRRAAEQDFPQAQYYLGAAYERGSGVEADLPLAAGWYQLAADQGVVLAAKRLDALKQEGVEPAEIIAASAPAEETPPTAEPEAPAMAEEAPPEESPAAGATEETNLIDSAPPPEPEAPAETPQQAEPLQEETVDASIEPATAEDAEAPQAEASQVEAPAAEAPSAAEPATVTATARVGERVATLEGSYRLRLASYRNPANADKGWLILTKKHADLLANFNYAVAEVDLGAEKGIYHRLETGPAGSLEEANVICSEIKSRGDSCVVVQP